MKEISITEIENVSIGNAQDFAGGTGCTVILCERGAPTGVDVRGGAPASRETDLLDPVATVDRIHAVLLSGGSAFGLDAAAGVMEYLERKNVGFDAGVAKVPIVCQSSLFDLVVGSAAARPDKAMGYQACVDSESNRPQEGNVGAGTGATVGKYHGLNYMMKSGLGIYAVQLGELKLAAIVAVNALGDVFDPETGKIIAGMLTPDLTGFANTELAMYSQYSNKKDLFTGNTTIGAIVTNGKFNKVQAAKIAAMAQNGYAKAIFPVHTTADGDSIYAMSVGDVEADINVVGTLAAKVTAKAVARAVSQAEPAYGLKSARDFL